MAEIQIERRMTENERYEKIMNFIRSNRKGGKNTIKAEVMKFMTQNGSSPVTAFKDITNLIKDEIITVRKEKPNSQTHYLMINDESEFIKLGRIVGSIYREQVSINKNLLGKGSLKNRLHYNKDYRNLLLTLQFFSYGTISKIATEITESIESENQRKALYYLIVQFLIESDKVNRLILPYVIDDLTRKAAESGKKAIRELFDNLKKFAMELVADSG